MNIRQKFVAALLLIGLLPMLAVGTIAYNTINNAQIRSTASQLNSTSVKQEQKITAVLQTKQEEVVRLANQFDLQVQLRLFSQFPTEGNRNGLATILQAKKVTLPTMQTVYLSDMEDRLIASSAIGSTLVDRPADLPSSSENNSVVIRKDPQDGFNKLYITTAVTVNKQRAASLTAVFRADDLVAIAQDYTGLGETGETVVTTKDNLALLPLRFDTEATLKTNVSSLGVSSAASGAYYEAKDYRGQTVFIVAHPIGSTGWIVAAKIDRNEAYAPIFALRDSLATAVLVASGLIISMAFLFTRFFTRPILEIGRISRQIGLGNFNARLDIHRKDEIGTLAESVNIMGTNLRDLVGGIESQRQRLQAVLDSTTEGIFAINDEAEVVLANRAAGGMLHQDPDMLTGKNINDLFEWKHSKQGQGVDYLSPGVRTYDLELTNPAGALKYAKVIVAGVVDPEYRHTTRAIVTVHDETSSREFETMKTDFVSMAAHELRTPLTAVRGYLEVALYKESKNDTTDTITYMRQALKNVAELGGLINNLLDVSRIERGTLTLTVEKIDLKNALERLIEDIRFAAEDKDITVAFAAEEEGPAFVVGDELALREIFNNLITNAIKYNHEKGHVDVTLARNADDYEVIVKDTGIGIPEVAIPHLFSKFYRVHGGLASGSGGTGLGLFIAKSIVERHHGKISVQSKEGVGSMFKVELPIFTEEAFRKQRPEDEAETKVRRSRGWVTKNITR